MDGSHDISSAFSGRPQVARKELQMSDVIVIGGGIVGAGAAYRLARDGVRVALVDRADPGQATAAGAGIISPGTSTRPLPALFPLGLRAGV
jgi:D-amino-acid dehydrogenase